VESVVCIWYQLPMSTKRSSTEVTEEESHDFSGPFDVLQLIEHLRLCLKEDPGNSNGDTVDSDNNGCALVEVSMDKYILTFHQLYK